MTAHAEHRLNAPLKQTTVYGIKYGYGDLP
jgi:hypothetical protein